MGESFGALDFNSLPAVANVSSLIVLMIFQKTDKPRTTWASPGGYVYHEFIPRKRASDGPWQNVVTLAFDWVSSV